MTVLQRKCRAALKQWTQDRRDREVCGIRHVHPRAYIVAQVASSCLVVACPPCDAEPHLREMNQKLGYKGGMTVVRTFEKGLTTGDWCTIGYVCVPGCQETVAIPVVES